MSVRAEDAERHMPSGFRPRDILLGQEGVGTLVTQAGSCEQVSVAGEAVEGSGVHGFAILLVHPPEDQEDPSIAIHALALHLVVGSRAELTPLEAAGLDSGSVGDGRVSLTRQGQGVVGEGSLSGDGFSTTQYGSGVVEARTGYSVRFYSLTGDPVFDAVLQDFEAGTGAGYAQVEGVDVPTTGSGYTIIRLPGGPFVEFHPIA